MTSPGADAGKYRGSLPEVRWLDLLAVPSNYAVTAAEHALDGIIKEGQLLWMYPQLPY